MKKILSTFIIWCIWLISFCSSIYFSEWNWNRYWSSSIWVNAGASVNISPAWNWEILWYWTFCITYNRWECSYNWNTYSTNWPNKTLCFFNDSSSTVNFSVSCTNTYTSKAYYYTFSSTELSWSLFECEECEECQECPIIDSQYCTDNNLCPSSDCPIYTWDWNWSALYINDIQHQSASVIDITIPDEYDWDYTWDEDQFNLNVIWYNVDTDYIEWIISNQTTKPNQTDLNNIITWVLPLFVPWLVIILFIYFIFKFLKKIF